MDRKIILLFAFVIILLSNLISVTAYWDSYSDWYNNYWEPQVVANFAGGHGYSGGYAAGSQGSNGGITQYTQSVVVNGNYGSNEPIIIINGNSNNVPVSYGNSYGSKPSNSYSQSGFDYYDPYYVPETPVSSSYLAVDYNSYQKTYYTPSSRKYSYNSGYNSNSGNGCQYGSNGCNSNSYSNNNYDYGYNSEDSYNNDYVVTRFDGNCYGDCDSNMPPSVYTDNQYKGYY